MKRLVTVVTLAILLVGLILFGLSDTDISVADTNIPDNEVASSISKASNYSVSAIIVITMTIESLLAGYLPRWGWTGI